MSEMYIFFRIYQIHITTIDFPELACKFPISKDHLAGKKAVALSYVWH